MITKKIQEFKLKSFKKKSGKLIPIEFKKQFRPKDTRGLGYTPENWEEKSKKKRRSKLKTSNKNVTSYRGITHPPSNKNVTEEIDPNFFIYKGKEVFQHFQLRSNENITIL